MNQAEKNFANAIALHMVVGTLVIAIAVFGAMNYNGGGYAILGAAIIANTLFTFYVAERVNWHTSSGRHVGDPAPAAGVAN